MTHLRKFELYDAVNGRTLQLESNNAVPVNIQDQHSALFNILFLRTASTTTTNGVATKEAYTMDVAAGHGITATDEIFVASGMNVMYSVVLSVATNTLTLDRPIPFAFPSGSNVSVVLHDMAVDGSTTPVTYIAGTSPFATESLDVTGIRFAIRSGSAPDDSKFGDLTALTRGLVLQKRTNAGEIYQYFAAKNNGDFGGYVDNKVYTDKAGGGDHSAEFSWMISRDQGVTIRIDPGDRIEIVVQDNLTALSHFHAVAIGHYVTD